MTDALMEREERALAPARRPADEINYASEIATELKKIVASRSLASKIQGKEYVAVEGWTTLAALRGCTPREVSNELDPTRKGVYVAVVELVNADGRVIGRASAECGDPDEVDRKGNPVWANRPAYARRSMANTRATSKVCRQVFSWIMTLAGYATTPAEEVPAEGFNDRPPQKRSEAPQSGDWDGSLPVKFGKYSKPPEGPKKWSELPSKYLEWVIENMDATKGPAVAMATKEIGRRAAIEAEEPIEGEVVDELPSENYQQGAFDMGPDPDDPRFR